MYKGFDFKDVGPVDQNGKLIELSDDEKKAVIDQWVINEEKDKKDQLDRERKETEEKEIREFVLSLKKKSR